MQSEPEGRAQYEGDIITILSVSDSFSSNSLYIPVLKTHIPVS